ncbi:putative Ig domain-containing protein [Spirosoma sp. SC4-14]|uniref:putative Ig domain-containing protein n=1 Tax=Spirosoma sp. SC4-14 TaxID=3128900 RepID=UPI0030CE5682
MKNIYSLRSVIGLTSLLLLVLSGRFTLAQTPTITGFAATSSTICSGSPASFTATIGNFSGSYDWVLANESIIIGSTDSLTTLSGLLPGGGSGVRSYTLTVTSAGQSNSATTSLTVLASGVTRLYVKANATGANTGLSWQDAFTDLQSALKYPCVGSLREIWIARGVYKPRSGDVNDAFSMLPDVAIYGGFEGTETELSQRPAITLSNPSSTTLSPDVDGDGTSANNSMYLINNTSSLTNTAILDGVVIIGTQASSNEQLGAITNSSGTFTDTRYGMVCSPQFRNLLFTGFVYVNYFNPINSGNYVLNAGYSGGELNPVFINCVFLNNQGGGNTSGSVYTRVTSGSKANVTFMGCVFANSSGPQIENYQIQTGQIQTNLFNCSFLSLADGILENSGYQSSTPINVELSNCVLWNTGGNATFKTEEGSFITSETTVQYSLLDQAITGYTSGPGNLTATSLPFVSTSDISLPNTSPAVNAGNPASVTIASGPYSATSLPQTDVAANPRIVGSRVDMGALEVQNPTPPCGTVVFVTEAGAGLQNGSSWTNAFSGTALQTAINTAATCGAQVWVAQGLYKPTTGTDPTISFSMKEGVAIYGGFVGTEGQLSDRPEVNPVTGQPSSSTLSGDIGTLGDSGEDSDNTGHVISNGPGLTASAVLDGFIITRGRGSDGSVLYGGGMRNAEASPTVRNCFFINNYGNNWGGAIYNENSSLTIVNCRFAFNTATDGGAIYNLGTGTITITGSLFEKHTKYAGVIYSTDNVKLVVSNSTFRQNSGNGGGVFYDNGNTQLELTDCLLENNTAGIGSVIYHSGQGAVKLTRCQFVNNSSTEQEGGAVYGQDSSLEAADCRFTGNSAVKEGGAVFFGGISLKLTNCIFENNRGGGDGGGAIEVNGGSASLINTSFVSNTATNGGAVLFYSDNYQVTNCSFVNNVAIEQGGAIYNAANSLQITNSSFQGNQSPQGGAYYSDYGGPAQLVNSALFNNGGANTVALSGGTSLSISYSLFEPSVTGYIDGGNNLTTTLTPFVSTTSTQLRDCSVAINSGSNQAYNAVSGPATDLAGNDRQYNGGLIDRGAYEYQGNPTTLAVTNPAVKTATVGQAFSQTFTASGGSGTYSFSVVNSNLPSSLSLSNNGVLNGTPTVAGSYSVLVQVSDANGCVGIASTAYNLVVTDATPTITGFAVAPNRVCVGSPITFTATIGNIAGDYSWSLENGGPPIGSPSPTTATAFSVVLTALGSGVQTFTLTVNSGGQRVTATTSLTVNALPIATLINNGPLTCAQTSVTLTASGGTSYSFTNGSGQTVPGSGNMRTVSSPGTYSVTVSDGNGCVSTSSTTVDQDVTAASVSITPSSATLTCANPSAILTANGTGSVLWSTGETNPAITVSAAGTYSVTLTNGSGCTATASAVISADQNAPSVSITPSSATLTCASSSVSLTAVGTGSVLWSTGAATPVITVNTASTYSVTLTNSSGCTATASVTIDKQPDQTVAIVQQPASVSSATVGNAVMTGVSVSGQPTSYQWYKDNLSSPVTGQTSATLNLTNVQLADAGSYSVVVTGTCNSLTSNAFSLSVTTPVETLPFAITAVTTVSCTPIVPNRFSVSFTPRYSGLNGQPISFQVVNELIPTTESGPYTLQLYTDNPTITLTAIQSGNSSESSYMYNWLAACQTSEATNTPPRLVTPIASQTAIVDTYFTFVIPDGTFTDTETPLSLRLSASGLPAGLHFEGATLSGVPSTTVGSPFSVTVTATDPGNLSANSPFLLTILPVTTTPPPTHPFAITGVTTNSCTPVADRININFSPQYVGLNGQPIAFEVVNELAPTTDPAPYSLTLYRDNPIIVLKATQTGSADVASFSYNWLAACASVGQDNTAPRINSPVASQTATVGMSYSLNLINTFLDQETPNSLTLTASGLPSGLSLAGMTLSGTPSLTGVSTVVLTATDPGGLSASTSFSLTVVPDSDAFVITGVQTLSCVVVSAGLRSVVFQPQYGGVTGQPINFQVVNELAATTAPGPYTLNLYTDNPVVTLKATQVGTVGEASFSYTWLSGCGSPRLAATESGTGLQVKVLGNPIAGPSVEVEIRGVGGQQVKLELVDLKGRQLQAHSIGQATEVELIKLEAGSLPSQCILQVSTRTQQQVIKLLKP